MKHTDEMKNKSREIGLEFNMARIRKRTDDYLVEYFNQDSGEIEDDMVRPTT